MYFMWNFFVRVVCERECEDSRQSEEQEVFEGSSQEAFLRNEACALHMIGMRRVRIEWRQLVFASVLRVRLSREILAKTNCLHPALTLRIPIMCRAHISLCGMLTHELPAKTTLVFNCLKSSLSLSHTQLLQINPT